MMKALMSDGPINVEYTGMAHKASLSKDQFPAIEDCHNIMLVALKKSTAWCTLRVFGGRHERKVEAISENR